MPRKRAQVTEHVVVEKEPPDLLAAVLESTRSRAPEPEDPRRMFTKNSLMLLAVKVATMIGFRLGKYGHRPVDILYRRINEDLPVPRELFDAIIKVEVSEHMLDICCGHLLYVENGGR